MKSTILKIFFIALALASTGAYAQFGSPATSLFIKLTPEFPEPGLPVVATLVSYSTDLNRATVTWTLDGKVLARGAGLKEVSFTAAALGSGNALKAVVETPELERFEVVAAIQPQSIDLIIEAQNKVPHWYEGAALPGPQNRVAIIAVPNFFSGKTKIAASSLVYNWRVDGKVMSDFSGRGKQSLTTAAPGVGQAPKEVSVKISSLDGTLAKEVSTSVRAFSPEILFYERKPLEGLVTSAALRKKIVAAGERFEVEAVPFFMNYLSLADLDFVWTFNGNSVEKDVDDPRAFAVNTIAGSEGEGARVGVSITNINNLYNKIVNFFDVEVE